MRITQAVALLSLLYGFVEAACECGYRTNTGETWQFAIITNFSSIASGSFSDSADWRITSLVREGGGVHPIAINYTAANVAVRNESLQLTCSAFNPSTDTAVKSAQIKTRRQDILQGSFRATYSITGDSGANGAFFFYANDTQEIDIETLTRKTPQTVHFANQPSSSVDVNLPNNFNRTSTLAYRFDWTSQETRFYVNDIISSNFSTNVPTSNGSISLSMWANGGTFTGSTPPSTDVVMQVSQIALYFNTSRASASADWTKSCQSQKVAACSVDAEAVKTNATKLANGGWRARSIPAPVKVAAVTAAGVYWASQ